MSVPDDRVPHSAPTYPQSWPVPTPTPPRSWQWLAAGIAGITGGFVVVTTMAGQVPFLLAGRSGMRIEQGVLILAELGFGVAVVLAAYLLAPGPLPMRLIGAAVFAGGVVVTLAAGTLRMMGPLRGSPMSLYLLNPHGLLLLAGAAGWLLAAEARPTAYLALAPTVLVFPMTVLLIRADLASPLATAATLGLSLLIALGVLAVSKPRTN